MGNGYWLNPQNGVCKKITRHELAMRDPQLLRELGVSDAVIDLAREVSPYSPEGEDELRMMGIDAGLVRIRDQDAYLCAQFRTSPERETELLAMVAVVFETESLWRPVVKFGNFDTDHTLRSMTFDEFRQQYTSQ